MQAILGTVGFIVCLVRPDAYFAYCVLPPDIQYYDAMHHNKWPLLGAYKSTI